MNNIRNIFLTGATGFLGGYLAANVLTHTHDRLLCLVRPHKRQDALKRVLNRIAEVISSKMIDQNRIQIIDGDTSLPNLGLLMSNRFYVDEVWHCAAVLDFEQHKEKETIRDNHLGLVHVLDFMEMNDIPVLNFFSTAYVAGNASGTFPEQYYSHSSETNNPYEQSKRLCEEEIMTRHKQKGLQYRILRPSIIVGHSATLEAESYSGLYGYLSFYCVLRTVLS